MATSTRFMPLEAFDRSREFEVRRALVVGGRSFKFGERFDATLVTTRRLRQLYEQRVVMMLPADAKPIVDKPSKPVFDKLPIEAIRMFLQEHGVEPRFKAKLPQLVEQASRLWDRQYGSQGAT